MLHTRRERDSLRILWSIIAPHNAHGREKAKVWRAASPQNTHMGILTRVWSNIAPHKPRTLAWNRRVEHWRSTRALKRCRVERQCSTQEIAPNVVGQCCSTHDGEARDIPAGDGTDYNDYAAELSGVHNVFFTFRGAQDDESNPELFDITGYVFTANATDPDPGDDDQDGDRQPSHRLPSTGVAVLGLSGAVAALAVAGVGLTIWRKRRA